MGAPEEASAPAAAAVRRLDVMEYHVVGNTVLDLASIEDALGPFLGPDRSLDDIDRARAALEAAYHDRGYKTVSVSLPRQSGAGGSIRLQVVEQTIGRVTVTGSRYHSPEAIRAEAPSLAEGQVPDLGALQQELGALNTRPDRRVTPALSAGRRPDTVDVDLVVDDELPLHGSLELNNRRSQGTSSLRASATLSYDNLWQAGHGVSLSLQAAPQRWADSKVLFGAYRLPLGSGATLQLTALRSDSEVAAVGGTNVIGKGRIFGLRADWPLSDEAGVARRLWAGLEYKDLESVTQLGDDRLSTPVRYWPLSLGYGESRRLDEWDLQGSLGLRLTLPGVGSDAAALDDNRFAARRQQAALVGQLEVGRPFGDGFEGRWRVHAQWTDQPLLSGEQLSIGGADTVRGYLESEALGDYGAVLGSELQLPSLLPAAIAGGPPPSGIDLLRPYVFVDAGVVQLDRALPEQQRRFGLASGGAGIRLGFGPQIEGRLEWARVLRRGAVTRSGDDRWLFRLIGSF